jgi:hypothetical protein
MSVAIRFTPKAGITSLMLRSEQMPDIKILTAAALLVTLGRLCVDRTSNYSLFGTRNNAALKSNVPFRTKHPLQNAASRRPLDF